MTGHHYPFIFKRLLLYVSFMCNTVPMIIIILTFGALQHCTQDHRQLYVVCSGSPGTLTLPETSFTNMFNLLQVKQFRLLPTNKARHWYMKVDYYHVLLVGGRLSFPNQHLTLTLPATIIFEEFHSKTLYNHFGKKRSLVWHLIPQKKILKLYSYFNSYSQFT